MFASHVGAQEKKEYVNRQLTMVHMEGLQRLVMVNGESVVKVIRYEQARHDRAVAVQSGGVRLGAAGEGWGAG